MFLITANVLLRKLHLIYWEMNFINVGTKFLRKTNDHFSPVSGRSGVLHKDEHSALPIGQNDYCFRVILLTFDLESVGP